MRAIHLLRKPLSESNLARNVLKHGTGGINVGGATVGTEVVFTHNRGTNTAFPKRPTEKTVEESGRAVPQDGVDQAPRQGRWPANLILEHRPGCQRAGTKRVRSHNPDSPLIEGANTTKVTYGKYARCSMVGHADEDGRETVEAWTCVEGCPVAELDEQGDQVGAHSAGSARASGQARQTGHGGMFGMGNHPGNGARFGDEGGVARFFKQVKGVTDKP